MKEGERLVISIAIGYGVNQGKEHKSKKVDQVITGKDDKPEWFQYGVKLALMAPTAINQQKFEITYEDGEVKVVDKGGVLSQVDLGIVKYHFEVGADSARRKD